MSEPVKISNKSFNAIITFFVWPFVGFIYGFINYKKPYFPIILWLFCGFLGYTFIISDPYMDANRYRDFFLKISNSPLNGIDHFISFYEGRGIYSATDLYLNGITILISKITSDFKVYFTGISLIFGYFLSRNYKLIIDQIKDEKVPSFAVLILIATFFLIPPWNINMFRFFTAAEVFLFGLLHYILLEKKKYIIFILLTPVIHFSMFFAVSVFIIYLIMGNRSFLFLIFYLISLLFINFDVSIINQNYELFPLFMQNKVLGYSSDEYVKLTQSNLLANVWYVKGRYLALQFVIIILLSYILVISKTKIREIKLFKCLNVGLLFLGFSNFVSSVPSMDRFLIISFTITFFALLMILTHQKIKHKNSLFLISILPILLFIIVELRIGFDFIGLNTLLLNPLIAPFFPDSPALIEFIK
jgi:hypothetical protein